VELVKPLRRLTRGVGISPFVAVNDPIRINELNDARKQHAMIAKEQEMHKLQKVSRFSIPTE
jgi:hypothetical protein